MKINEYGNIILDYHVYNAMVARTRGLVMAVYDLRNTKIDYEALATGYIEEYMPHLGERQAMIAIELIREKIKDWHFQFQRSPYIGLDIEAITADVFRFLGFQITEPMSPGQEDIPKYSTKENFHILNYKSF